MRITGEITLEDFEAWSGAKDTKETIISEGKEVEFDMLIEDLYPDGLTDTDLNDILWHDSVWVYETLGIDID